jgi:hypothetical protein
MNRRPWILCAGLIALLACIQNANAAISDSLRVTGQGQGPQAGRTFVDSIDVSESPTDPDIERHIDNSLAVPPVYLPATKDANNPIVGKLITLMDPAGGVSDSLEMTVFNGVASTEVSLVFEMISGTGAKSGGTQITETGAEIDVTRLLFPQFTVGAEPYKVLVFSDVEIPEPASLSMLAFGGALLSIWMRATGVRVHD